MYRVERKKPRLVDRFSDELLRGFPSFRRKEGELWDVSLPLRQSATAAVRRGGGAIEVKGFSAAAIDNEEKRL